LSTAALDWLRERHGLVAAISKERQSITARADVWLMVVAVPVCEIVAAPPGPRLLQDGGRQCEQQPQAADGAANADGFRWS
jgi:hypothetical protein